MAVQTYKFNPNDEIPSWLQEKQAAKMLHVPMPNKSTAHVAEGEVVCMTDWGEMRVLKEEEVDKVFPGAYQAQQPVPQSPNQANAPDGTPITDQQPQANPTPPSA